MSKDSLADQYTRREKGQFASESGRAAVRRRWQHDPQGIAAAVQKIVDRAPALTAEQRELIRAAFTVPACTSDKT